MKKNFLLVAMSLFLSVSFSSVFCFGESEGELRQLREFEKAERSWQKAVKYLDTKGKEMGSGGILLFKGVKTKDLIHRLFNGEFKKEKISKGEIEKRARKMFAQVHPDQYAARQNEEVAKKIYYTIEEVKQELLARLEDDRFVKTVRGERYLKVDSERRERRERDRFGNGLRLDGKGGDLFGDLFKDFFKDSDSFGGKEGMSCTRVCTERGCRTECKNY